MTTSKTINNILPFVSICTPTFNRRPFIPFLVKCFMEQIYPRDRMEWIIVDDGTDSIIDLIENLIKNYNLHQIKYHYYKERMLLGKKRNIMHSFCKGDIIIYMDDDDFYPKERVSHAVEVLENNKNYLIAGSSEMHIYFKNINKMYQFGPYVNNHSTAATFAFRKELLLETNYDDNSEIAEETFFLKNYSIPLIQLDVLKTILVISHYHNSFDKNILLENPNESRIKDSPYVIDDFIKSEELKEFYINNLNNILLEYEDGHPKHKPQILNKIKNIKDNRMLRELEYKKSLEIKQMKEYYENIIKDKNYLIQELLKKLKEKV
jgi:glycosyltransferase involved in cell wall biosynthesis